jgi:hypothetical protein
MLQFPAPRRIVDELTEDHRTRRSQWSSRPPVVERLGMTVSRNGLFFFCRTIDGIERQRNFYEFFGGP